jgi:ribosomal peptide maturation radical SAM protein 1
VYKVLLVNMPFSNLSLPSIALTQLKSMVQSKLNDRVTADVIYLNHDFAHYLGVELYNYLTNSGESMNTGLGEWFFRQIAFPDTPDNTAEYTKRYFASNAPESVKRRDEVLRKRSGLAAFMDALIKDNGLDRAQIVGFTSMFMQHTASLAMSQKLKRLNPELITVIGGANCDYPMGAVIARQFKHVDYVFSGPALKSFPEFVQRCLEGNRSEVNSIRGIFSKDSAEPQAGSPVIGEETPIDIKIELDYDAFLDRYEKFFPDTRAKATLPFETSRGCWWGEKAHCTFCGLNGDSMKYRAMRPDLAVEQFQSLFRYAGRVSKLEAVDNILPKSYFSEVLPAITPPPGMTIFYEVKADLSEEQVAALAMGGVTQVQPGIEALATSTLKLMKKGTTSFQNVALLKACAHYAIQPVWNLLVGFPGETEDVYRRYVEILPLLAHLPPPTGAFPVRFDRFSPYFTQAKAYGLDLYPLDFYALVYPFPAEELKQMAYYFADRNIQADYFTSMAKWIGRIRAKVTQWHSKWANTALPPRLHFHANSNDIYDSRTGVAIRHSFGEKGRQILEFLAKPNRLETVVNTFAAGNGADTSVVVENLTKAGLLFQEGDRLLSLVLDGEHGSKKGSRLRQEILVRKPAPAVSELVQLGVPIFAK